MVRKALPCRGQGICNGRKQHGVTPNCLTGGSGKSYPRVAKQKLSLRWLHLLTTIIVSLADPEKEIQLRLFIPALALRGMLQIAASPKLGAKKRVPSCQLQPSMHATGSA